LKPEQLDAKRLAPSLVRSPLDGGEFQFNSLKRIWVWGIVTLPGSEPDDTNHGMKNTLYRGYHFPPEIIQLTVRMYAHFTLSLRDVEELLAERGLDVSYETVRRWFLKFGRVYAQRLRQTRDRDPMSEVLFSARC
jgi:hypothetical protein